MGLYLCRWENGDFSVVQAESKEHAIEMLDEVANAEGMPLYTITDFMVHFRLNDDGTLELEGFGEAFYNCVRERVHPILGELDVSLYDAGPKDRSRIKKAVNQERCRVKAKPAPEPDTELGKQIKSEMDLPTSVINRHIKSVATDFLRKTKPKGKIS
jgi:hypothetical protein